MLFQHSVLIPDEVWYSGVLGMAQPRERLEGTQYLDAVWCLQVVTAIAPRCTHIVFI